MTTEGEALVDEEYFDGEGPSRESKGGFASRVSTPYVRRVPPRKLPLEKSGEEGSLVLLIFVIVVPATFLVTRQPTKPGEDHGRTPSSQGVPPFFPPFWRRGPVGAVQGRRTRWQKAVVVAVLLRRTILLSRRLTGATGIRFGPGKDSGARAKRQQPPAEAFFAASAVVGVYSCQRRHS